MQGTLIFVNKGDEDWKRTGTGAAKSGYWMGDIDSGSGYASNAEKQTQIGKWKLDISKHGLQERENATESLSMDLPVLGGM